MTSGEVLEEDLYEVGVVYRNFYNIVSQIYVKRKNITLFDFSFFKYKN